MEINPLYKYNEKELLETNNEVVNEKFEYVNNYNFFLLNRTFHVLGIYCSNMYGSVLKSLVKNSFGILKSRITDGYWLTFLSPFVLLSWIIALIITATYCVIALPLTIPLALFCLPACIWGILFEIPSSFINKRKDLKVKRYKFIIEPAPLFILGVILFLGGIATIFLVNSARSSLLGLLPILSGAAIIIWCTPVNDYKTLGKS
jgi:hypothetical protein